MISQQSFQQWKCCSHNLEGAWQPCHFWQRAMKNVLLYHLLNKLLRRAYCVAGPILCVLFFWAKHFYDPILCHHFFRSLPNTKNDSSIPRSKRCPLHLPISALLPKSCYCSGLNLSEGPKDGIWLSMRALPINSSSTWILPHLLLSIWLDPVWCSRPFSSLDYFSTLFAGLTSL